MAVTHAQIKKNMKKIPAMLEKYRMDNGLTYEGLGKKLNVSKGYAKLLCSGDRKPKDIDALMNIEKKTKIKIFH